MTIVTCFSSHLLTSLPTSVGEFYWLDYVWMHDQSNLFLSSSAHFITNISWWVLLNCVCIYGCMTIVTCFSSHLLTSLPTSVGEFYWLDYVWMHDQSNLFLSSSAHFITNISWWVLLNCVCIYGCMTRVICFSPHLLTRASAHFITNISRWVLLNCVCMDN